MALTLTKRSHAVCDDCYYSCPMAPEDDYCGNLPHGSRCDCGADDYNRLVDAHVELRAQLAEVTAELEHMQMVAAFHGAHLIEEEEDEA